MIAGGLKLSYDVLMLGMFLGYRTQEERAEEQAETAADLAELEREEGRDELRDAA